MNEIEELASASSRYPSLDVNSAKVLSLLDFCRKGQVVGASHGREGRKPVAIIDPIIYPVFLRWSDVRTRDLHICT